MLEPERRARTHREAGPLPAELPDDLSGGPGHLVDRAGIPGRDQQVAVRCDRDRVDMEVVERRRRGAAGERHVGVGHRHVVEAAPFEQHLAGRDVDLLDHAGQRHPMRRAAHPGQVGRHRPDGGDERGVLRADDEFVQVDLEPASFDGGDGAVGGVGDDRLALPGAPDDLPFPPGEHGVALVALDLEVNPPHALAGREAGVRRVPDDAAVPVQDHQPRRAGPGEGISGRRQDEVRGIRGSGGAMAGDGQRGRGQIGTAHEVQDPSRVVRRDRCGRYLLGGRRGPRPRVTGDARRGQPAHARHRHSAPPEQLPARPSVCVQLRTSTHPP